MSAVIKMETVSKKFTLRHQKARSFQEALIALFQRRNDSKEEFWALKDVNCEVQQGETIGIIGENGSGKSTMLKLITRILEPTAGKVHVNGKVSALIELGAGFHPDLTGRENVYLNGSILGLSKRMMDRKLEEIVDFSELERFIDTPVKHYSSGMYARLGFSVAISVDPDILIIDEVLSVGDESFQRKCIDKIREFKAKDVSIVFVSHSLDSVKSLCERAIWLQGGKVVFEGKTSQVADRYLIDSNLADQARVDRQLSGRTLRPVSDQNRWGSREIEITRVRMLDREGRDRVRFLSGEDFIVRMEYRVFGEVSGPVFGIALYSSDGTQITGPNTTTSGYAISRVSGEGWVDYVVSDLPLVSGSYELSVAAYDQTRSHAFDHHHRLYGFMVLHGRVTEDLGLVRIPCRWEHVPAAVAVPVSSD